MRWGGWDGLFILRWWWVGEWGFKGWSFVEGERGRGWVEREGYQRVWGWRVD